MEALYEMRQLTCVANRPECPCGCFCVGQSRSKDRVAGHKNAVCTRNMNYAMVVYFAQVGRGNPKPAEGFDGVWKDYFSVRLSVLYDRKQQNIPVSVMTLVCLLVFNQIAGAMERLDCNVMYWTFLLPFLTSHQFLHACITSCHTVTSYVPFQEAAAVRGPGLCGLQKVVSSMYSESRNQVLLNEMV